MAQAAWPRCLNVAAFASLKKYASHFFNHAFGVTEPKEATYETTGKSVLLGNPSLKCCHERGTVKRAWQEKPHRCSIAWSKKNLLKHHLNLITEHLKENSADY